jgi:hypothetical protein
MQGCGAQMTGANSRVLEREVIDACQNFEVWAALNGPGIAGGSWHRSEERRAS